MNPSDMRKTPEGYFTTRWGLPEYTDWIDESMSWKENCYIGDWSFLWQRRYKGADALRLFSDFSVNSLARFDIDQSKHVTHTTRHGKIIAEGILTRIAEDEVRLFGRGTFWIDFQLARGDYKVESIAEEGYNFQVAGPKAAAVMEALVGSEIRDVKFMRNGTCTIAGKSVTALRQGMSGEPGWELQGPAEDAQVVYDAVLQAGQAFGMRKLGGRAAFINHLEACFPTIVTDYLPAIFDEDMQAYLAAFKAGLPAFASTFNVAGSFDSADVADWYRSPVELGWGKNIKFDHDFLGRAALEAEGAQPRRVMRTLEWNGEDVADVHASLFREGTPYHFMEMPRDQRGFMYADRVLANGGDVGVSTSRGYSYYFRKMLSLCVIDVAHAEPGTEVVILWGEPGEPQKEIRATVAPAPYKRDNRRVDMHTV